MNLRISEKFWIFKREKTNWGSGVWELGFREEEGYFGNKKLKIRSVKRKKCKKKVQFDRPNWLNPKSTNNWACHQLLNCSTLPLMSSIWLK